MKRPIALVLALCAACAIAAPGGPDLVELVGADRMPVAPPPGAIDKPDSDRIAEFVRIFDTVTRAASSAQAGGGAGGRVHRDLATLRLSFTPAAAPGTLLAAAPAGTLAAGAWTGADRFFAVEGGKMQLSEFDLGATGGKFYMLEDAVNSRVGGKPAVSRMFSDGQGAVLTQVVWVRGPVFYMLTFLQAQAGGAASAWSLAQAVR